MDVNSSIGWFLLCEVICAPIEYFTWNKALLHVDTCLLFFVFTIFTPDSHPGVIAPLLFSSFLAN